MQSGRLTYLIDILERRDAAGATDRRHGTRRDTFEIVVSDVAAERVRISAAQTQEASELFEDARVTWRVWDCTPVKAFQRVRCEGVEYDVLAIEPDRPNRLLNLITAKVNT